jgi:hypothetical protein
MEIINLSQAHSSASPFRCQLGPICQPLHATDTATPPIGPFLCTSLLFGPHVLAPSTSQSLALCPACQRSITTTRAPPVKSFSPIAIVTLFLPRARRSVIPSQVTITTPPDRHASLHPTGAPFCTAPPLNARSRLASPTPPRPPVGQAGRCAEHRGNPLPDKTRPDSRVQTTHFTPHLANQR